MTTSSKPRRKRELAAKLVFDDSLLGDVGFLSEDLWADIFGALPAKREVGEDGKTVQCAMRESREV